MIFRPVIFTDNTKSLSPLKQSTAENVEIAVNPSDVVMRGTVFPEVEQTASPSPTQQNQSTESLRERFVF